MNKKTILVGMLLFGLLAGIFVWAGSGRSPSCCVSMDGYCMDINYLDGLVHTGKCGPDEWMSPDYHISDPNLFCGQIAECEMHPCEIDSVEMPRKMNKFQCNILCDKLQKEGLCSSCSWNGDPC